LKGHTFGANKTRTNFSNEPRTFPVSYQVLWFDCWSLIAGSSAVHACGCSLS